MTSILACLVGRLELLFQHHPFYSFTLMHCCFCIWKCEEKKRMKSTKSLTALILEVWKSYLSCIQINIFVWNTHDIFGFIQKWSLFFQYCQIHIKTLMIQSSVSVMMSTGECKQSPCNVVCYMQTWIKLYRPISHVCLLIFATKV